MPVEILSTLLRGWWGMACIQLHSKGKVSALCQLSCLLKQMETDFTNSTEQLESKWTFIREVF